MGLTSYLRELNVAIAAFYDNLAERINQFLFFKTGRTSSMRRLTRAKIILIWLMVWFIVFRPADPNRLPGFWRRKWRGS